MKTIILYATKYGSCADIAQRIAGKIDGSVTHNLKEAVPSLEEFDCIILGSPVYAGSIRKEAKRFLLHSADILLKKKNGLFLCGMDTDSKDAFFSANFSPEILEKTAAKDFLGGVYDPKKANFFERFIMKLITKQSGCISAINDGKIEKFAEEMKA